MSVASLVTGMQLCKGSPAFQRPRKVGNPHGEGDSPALFALSMVGREGDRGIGSRGGQALGRGKDTPCDSWTHREGIVHSLQLHLFPSGWRTEENRVREPLQGTMEKAGSWQLEKRTLEPLWGPASSSQAKTEDVEKAQITLDLIPLPARGFDSFSYFTPLCSMLCFELLLFKIKIFSL